MAQHQNRWNPPLLWSASRFIHGTFIGVCHIAWSPIRCKLIHTGCLALAKLACVRIGDAWWTARTLPLLIILWSLPYDKWLPWMKEWYDAVWLGASCNIVIISHTGRNSESVAEGSSSSEVMESWQSLWRRTVREVPGGAEKQSVLQDNIHCHLAT